MTIANGTPAPPFTLPTLSTDGPELVSLDSFKGKSHVVLLFFPMAFTSVCTDEMCSLSSDFPAYESLDADILAISGDNPFSQAQWAEKEGIKVTLLSDYEHEVAKAYGVAYDSFLPEKNLPMGGVPKRSAFVIDKDGKVRHSEVLESPGDLPDFEKIKQVLGSL